MNSLKDVQLILVADAEKDTRSKGGILRNAMVICGEKGQLLMGAMLIQEEFTTKKENQ